MKRWKAEAKHFNQTLTYEFEELHELHELIEGGPDWFNIESITLTLNERPLKTFQVTIAWDNFPEGGTYRERVQAHSADEAEEIVRDNMAIVRADEHTSAAEVREEWDDDWVLIDADEIPEVPEFVKDMFSNGYDDYVERMCAEPDVYTDEDRAAFIENARRAHNFLFPDRRFEQPRLS